jgi:RNA polymerase sigma-70 factor (ECF subfamily)
MTTKSLPARSEDNYAQNIGEIYDKYAKMIYRLSFSYVKNKHDAEDIISDVFVKLIKSKPDLQNEEHEKAWILRTAVNLCKDRLKRKSRKHASIDEYENLQAPDAADADQTLISVMELPDKYKSVIYLYYYEGYSCEEIAGILKKPHSSVRVHLHKARKLLKEVLLTDEK